LAELEIAPHLSQPRSGERPPIRHSALQHFDLFVSAEHVERRLSRALLSLLNGGPGRLAGTSAVVEVSFLEGLQSNVERNWLFAPS
jgi:hypothetical protein